MFKISNKHGKKNFQNPKYFEEVVIYLYDKHIICKLHKNNTGI